MSTFQKKWINYNYIHEVSNWLWGLISYIDKDAHPHFGLDINIHTVNNNGSIDSWLFPKSITPRSKPRYIHKDVYHNIIAIRGGEVVPYGMVQYVVHNRKPGGDEDGDRHGNVRFIITGQESDFHQHVEPILEIMCKFACYLDIGTSVASSSSSSEPIDIFIYLFDIPKRIRQGTIVEVDDINSGYTYFSDDTREVVIFRIEELLKVYIHEMAHLFDIDKENARRLASQISGPGAGKDAGTSPDTRPGHKKKYPLEVIEASAEMYARIVNAGMHTYINLHLQGKRGRANARPSERSSAERIDTTTTHGRRTNTPDVRHMKIKRDFITQTTRAIVRELMHSFSHLYADTYCQYDIERNYRDKREKTNAFAYYILVPRLFIKSNMIHSHAVDMEFDEDLIMEDYKRYIHRRGYKMNPKMSITS